MAASDIYIRHIQDIFGCKAHRETIHSQQEAKLSWIRLTIETDLPRIDRAKLENEVHQRVKTEQIDALGLVAIRYRQKMKVEKIE